MLGSINGFDEVIAKLSFHRAVHFKQWFFKHHIVKSLNHIAFVKLTQIAATLFRRAARVLLGKLIKISTFG